MKKLFYEVWKPTNKDYSYYTQKQLDRDIEVFEKKDNTNNRYCNMKRKYQVIDKQLVEVSKLQKGKFIELSTRRRAAVYEKIFDIIYDCHIENQHKGRDITFNLLAVHYFNITNEVIKIFLKTCPECKAKKHHRNVEQISEIKAEKTLRVQIELIDFQLLQDGEYKYILNIQDHFTKFVILKPLKSKSAVEVANNLYDYFSIFGPPTILQSDNGREFRNNVIEKLREFWPGRSFVHGRLRKDNGATSISYAKKSIQNWVRTTKCRKWSIGLPIIQFEMNRSKTSEAECSPYEAMFGERAKLAKEQKCKITDDVRTINQLVSISRIDIEGETFYGDDDIDDIDPEYQDDLDLLLISNVLNNEFNNSYNYQFR
jgi:hypothetical protein